MVSSLFYYQLALIRSRMALRHLLHVTWSKPRSAHPTRTKRSPSGLRSNAPKAFEGLTRV